MISSLNVAFEEEGEWRFPLDKPAYKLTTRMTTRGRSGDIAHARQRVEHACIPATDHQVEEWLAVLQAATAGLKKSDSTQMVTLRLYANALKRYPADIAQAACIELTETCRWFPVLADVLALCDDLFSQRKEWLARLGFLPLVIA